ncbi:uncharacterized protein G2W53_018012 [Senna tora]|uniref:Uncharacterized protein n=1 Tax=Senna tora TaxID=362788 RepID=A0A834WN00_9FABA|nr:uncharacterized protein G2W53_018012 [Senna tora]
MPHQSQRHDALFLGFQISGISMPYQSLGLIAWFLKISRISMPCQSPGLDPWFLGFKISGTSIPCQSPGISMPSQTPGLDALPMPRSRCLVP